MTRKKAELLGAAAILLAYLPTYLFTFAVTDDWQILDRTLNSTTRWGLFEISQGRPLHGLAVTLADLTATSLEGFQVFRFVCVLSLVLLYVLMGRFLTSIKFFESLKKSTPPPSWIA